MELFITFFIRLLLISDLSINIDNNLKCIYMLDSQQVKESRIKQQKPKEQIQNRNQIQTNNQIQSRNLIIKSNHRFQTNTNIDTLVKDFSKKITNILEASKLQQKTFFIQKKDKSKSKQFSELSQQQRLFLINNQNQDCNICNKQFLNNDSQIYANATKIKAPQRLNIQDLETSLKKQNAKNNQLHHELRNSRKIRDFDQKSSLKSSRIVTKLNQMEEFYNNKIRQLTIQNSYLINQNSHLESKNKNLLQSVTIFKQIAQRKKADMESQIQQKLNQIKENLIERFSLQSRQSYKAYVEEIKKINQNLMEQKKKRTYFQNQCKVLTIQKQNIQSMYKQILQNHKDLIRFQINQTTSEINSQIYSQSQTNERSILQKNQKQDLNNIQRKKDNTYYIENSHIIYNSRKKSHDQIQKNDFRNQKKQNNEQKNKLSKDSKSTIKKQKKKAIKNKKEQSKSEICPKLQMSRQELIPFLASGIQQLKQKLRLQ